MDMDIDTADAIAEVEDSAQISKTRTPGPQLHRHAVVGGRSSHQAKTGVDDYGVAALTTVET